MFLLKLLLKNAFRHRLRTALTLVGLVVAISAFGLLRTIVDAWYSGVQASSSTRLITRSNVSLTFALPASYAQRLRGLPNVRYVSGANWFGGVYIDERNFFFQLAVDPVAHLAMFPEFRMPEEQKEAFVKDRQGVVVGRKLANRFGWKVGDQIPLRGTIYPGTWTFNLRGIWDGAEPGTDESQMLMHWDYLNEVVRQRHPGRADQVSMYFIGIDAPANASVVSQEIDTMFANSRAETLTETEAAFQLGFIAMSEAILVAVRAVSMIIVLIIMTVMANTMTMTARERLAEYATLKALGFGPGFVHRLLLGEALLIGLIGGIAAMLLTVPMASAFRAATGALFPTFHVSHTTQVLQIAAALGVGAVAAAWPAWKMGRMDIVAGLRHVG